MASLTQTYTHTPQATHRDGSILTRPRYPGGGATRPGRRTVTRPPARLSAMTRRMAATSHPPVAQQQRHDERDGRREVPPPPHQARGLRELEPAGRRGQEGEQRHERNRE